MTEYPGEDEGRPNPSTDPDAQPDTRSEPEGRPAGEPDYETEPQRGDDAKPEPDGGHPLVEETMARLEDLRDRPVNEHGEVYADLHERLQEALSDADTADGVEQVQ